MKRTITLIAAMSFGAASLWAYSAQPADLTGTWTGLVNLPNGQKVPFIAHLKVQADSVSGVLDGINGGADVPISQGKVSGDTLTFSGVRVINGMNVTFNYTATPEGESGLTFKIARADGTGAPLESKTQRLSTIP
jgi:hypothetical protein